MVRRADRADARHRALAPAHAGPRDAADRALAKAEEFHQVAKGYRDEGTNAHQRAYEHRVQCIRILDQAHQITKGDQQ